MLKNCAFGTGGLPKVNREMPQHDKKSFKTLRSGEVMRRSPIAKRGKAGESLKVGGAGGRRGGKKPRKQNIDDEEEEDLEDHESPLPPLQGCPSTGR